MNVQEIVSRVRGVIDELEANASGFINASGDEKNLTDVIKTNIPYALVYLLENAPVEKLDENGITGQGSYVSGTFSIDNTTMMGQAQLPDNVLRIVSARLSSWKYSPLPVTEHSQEYMMQGDEYARGTWDRPVTAIVHRAGSRWIELYSAKSLTDTLNMLVYKKPDLADLNNNDAEVRVPQALEGAFVYHLAGLVLTAFRDDHAGNLLAIARSYAGIE